MDSEPKFILFGTAHIAAMVIVAVVSCSLPAAVRQIEARGWTQFLARTLGLIIIIILAIKTWWLAFAYGLTWERLLPLQICDANVFLCALMLHGRSYRLYEIAYFWAMSGSIVAMITPDLRHGFPHLSFIVFYLGHGLTVVAVLYATFAFNFKPRLHSVVVATKVTAYYALAVLAVNFALDTNYLYLLHKPKAPSILDYFGPWPWYVMGLAMLTITSFYICYIPIALTGYFAKKD